MPIPTFKREELCLIGSGLREDRNRINKTQEEMAKDFELSPRTWGKYERRETIPDALMLSRLYHLGIDIFYIVTGNRAPVTIMDMKEEKLIKQYRNADESVQFVIQSLFDALKL